MYIADTMLIKVTSVFLMCIVGSTHTEAVRRRRQHNVLGYESKNCIHHLCTNVTNYPTMYIENLINAKTEFHPYFGSVIQPYNQPTLRAKSANSHDNGKNMCETLRFTYYPESALNKHRKRMLIVNVDKFKQAVSFETCLPKADCFLSANKPIGYETFCKQQYNLIRLVSMTEDGTIILDSFPIPSSCACSYKIMPFNKKR